MKPFPTHFGHPGPHSHDDPILFGAETLFIVNAFFMHRQRYMACAALSRCYTRDGQSQRRKGPVPSTPILSSTATCKKKKESTCSLFNLPTWWLLKFLSLLFTSRLVSSYANLGQMLMHEPQFAVTTVGAIDASLREYGSVSPIERLNGQLLQKMAASKLFAIFDNISVIQMRYLQHSHLRFIYFWFKLDVHPKWFSVEFVGWGISDF